MLGTLLLVLLVFLLIFFIRYRAQLAAMTAMTAMTAHNDSTDPAKELGLSFYNNKGSRDSKDSQVLYLDRPHQHVNEDCMSRMPTNEYMTIAGVSESIVGVSDAADVYEVPVTVM